MSKPKHNDIAQGVRDLIAEVNRLRWLNGHMLEALKECRNAMHADNPADGWAEIIVAADAAIAKAEGR